MTIYSMRNARKAYGANVVLDDVSLSFLPGARVGVVGPNGAGKSTVLRIMAGLEPLSSGTAFAAPGLRREILLQDPQLDDDADVRGNVEEAVADVRAMLVRYEQVTGLLVGAEQEDLDDLLHELGDLQERLDHMRAWDVDSRLEQAMGALRCPPPGVVVRFLSGGERRRVALCRILMSQPDLLLLDEPTNHLDAESVQWLEAYLAEYPGTVVAVTHDRYFLDNVAGWILELDHGHAYPYEGNYSTYLETKASRLELVGAKDAKLRLRLAEELDWVRSSAPARQAKSRARLSRYDQLASEAESSRRLDFDEIQIPPGPRLGSVVVEADHLTKGFGDRLLIDDMSFSLPRGGVVGVLGPNGVGKTTLFQMLVGEEAPDGGTLRVGDTVVISYVDQQRVALDSGKNVWQLVSGGMDYIRLGDRVMSSRAYVATFGFKGSDQQKPVGMLSGGERNRLNLALTLKSGGNLLLLDEPTNDLDVDTLASLEKALLRFPGCVVVTAHDRWFLDRVATHILAWEGGASWVWFEGNFADYRAHKVGSPGNDTARQDRLTHRRLIRG